MTMQRPTRTLTLSLIGMLRSAQCLDAAAWEGSRLIRPTWMLCLERLYVDWTLIGPARDAVGYFFVCFCFPSHLLSSPFNYLCLLVVTQIRGHIAGSSPPPTHYGSCLAFFIARRFQLFLLPSTRVELCLPTLGALSS